MTSSITYRAHAPSPRSCQYEASLLRGERDDRGARPERVERRQHRLVHVRAVVVRRARAGRRAVGRLPALGSGDRHRDRARPTASLSTVNVSTRTPAGGSSPPHAARSNTVHPTAMRTCVRALAITIGRERPRAAALPGYRGATSWSATSTRPRPSTPGSTRSARSPPSTASRPARSVPFSWTVNPYRGCAHACLYCFARPDARVPRTSTRAGLRARDRREGQRAGGAAGRAGAAVVGGRARRAGHEHRPVPVGRGPLQADARHLGGAARLRQPVLDPHEVAAGAARRRPADARSPSARTSARACRCRRWTRRPGARPSRTRRTRGRGSRRWRSSTGPASRPAS